MADHQQDARRSARAEARQVARSEGAADVDAMTLQVDRALGAVRSDQFWTDIIAALPRTMDKDSFRQIATTAIMSDPKLLTADRRSLMTELMFCARMGLMPGGYGEVALFADGAGRVQHRVEYGGILKLAHNSGMVASADAVAVYEGEHCEIGPTDKPLHRYSLRERGEWLGCYAYVERLNGRWQVEWMTAGEIRRHAQRYSEALRQKRQTPWNDPEAETEMGNKTVLRRLLKYVPKSPEVAAVLAHEDEMDRATFARDVTSVQQSLPAPRGWGRQFDAGNGQDEAAQSRQDAATAPQQPQRTPTPPEPAAAPSALAARPRTGLDDGPPLKRRPGRPTKAEVEARQRAQEPPGAIPADRIARRIIDEINDAGPEDVDGLLQTHEEAIAGLPDALRTEVVAAASERMAAAEGEDEEQPFVPENFKHNPETGEVEPDDGFDAWKADMEAKVAGMPWDMRRMPVRKEHWLRDAEQWGERGRQAVEEAFAR